MYLDHPRRLLRRGTYNPIVSDLKLPQRLYTHYLTWLYREKRFVIAIKRYAYSIGFHDWSISFHLVHYRCFRTKHAACSRSKKLKGILPWAMEQKNNVKQCEMMMIERFLDEYQWKIEIIKLNQISVKIFIRLSLWLRVDVRVLFLFMNAYAPTQQ